MVQELKSGWYMIVDASLCDDNGKFVRVVGAASNGDIVVETPEWLPTIGSGTFQRYDRAWCEQHLKAWPILTASERIAATSPVSVASFDGTLADSASESVGRGE